MNVLRFGSGVCHLEIEKDWFTNCKGLFFEVKAARHLRQHDRGPAKQ
jgi:hypothetical protein